MIRAKVTAEGRVQRVGYRERVQDTARELGMVGEVGNLKGGEVEIICEGERQVVENFIKAIEIRDGLIEVKKITRTFEEPTGEFTHFGIKYGDIQEELTESIGAGRRELVSIRESIDTGFSRTGSDFQTLGEKVDAVGEKVDAVGEKVDKVGENVKTVGKNVINVGEKIDVGFSKTDSNFKDLDGKYDVVSKELKSINKNISKLTGYVGDLVEEFVKKKKIKTAGRKR